jgi:hypothetical protein
MEWLGPPDYLCERDPIDCFGIGKSGRFAGDGERNRAEPWWHCVEPVDVHD